MDQNDFNELLKIQRMMAARIIQETTVDRKIEFTQKIIKQLTTDKNKKILKETIMHEAKQEGFTEEETQKFLEELIKEKTIEETEEGYIRLL